MTPLDAYPARRLARLDDGPVIEMAACGECPKGKCDGCRMCDYFVELAAGRYARENHEAALFDWALHGDGTAPLGIVSHPAPHPGSEPGPRGERTA